MRSVVLLLMVAVLGWLVARFVLPPSESPQDMPAALAPAAPAPSALGETALRGPLGAVAPNPLPSVDSSTGAFSVPSAAPSPPGLDELLQLQAELSQRAERSMGGAGSAAPGTAGESVPSTGSPVSPATAAQEARLLERRQAIIALQNQAMAEIRAVRPGDTQALIKAIEKFDAQMRQAGAPALLDMDGIRKTLQAADRIQQLNTALVAEANKGRDANPERIQSLSAQLQMAQQALSNPIVKTDVLKGLLQP